ncbi:metallophosphoesterase [Corynebacterium sp. ES2794-CONJ1]|uniref:metallophosphoesterase n=1 Tax=Corynebacterium sp. ES2794-CONJ1 TaxID=2980553 RepID=UPI0021D96FC5|nr:metallophosphoesterase [Corynebacterium sp. ES2794-CONJ1]MCU9519609.1 metallophosphoesterase [Corynebacterium sp. ES2794-CONJ1]
MNKDFTSSCPRWASQLLKIGSLGAIAGTAALWWGYKECERFELEEVEVPLLSPGTLRSREAFSILHISDIHMVPGQKKKQEWIADLARLKPDLVVNTGDNLSDLHAIPSLLAAIQPLFAFPGLFVFGSNDYFGPKPVNPFLYLVGRKRKVSRVELPWKDMRAVFLEHGWRDATHQRHEFKVSGLKVAATGVDDPHHDLDDYGSIAGAPNPQADMSLALVHCPEPRVLARFAADGYQLSLSGHTHGGQICLPGSMSLVTNCGIDRARAKGLHQFKHMAMYVSKGLGTSKFAPIRLFCRPSATLLKITEKSS